jgi:hypothetical protein
MSWNQNPYQQPPNIWGSNQPNVPPPQQGFNQPPQMPSIFPEQSGFQHMPSNPPQQPQFNAYGQNPPQMNQPYQGGYPQYPPQQSEMYNAIPSQQVQLMPIGSGQRKALLVGINYINTPAARLNGPINDVQNMVQFLSQKGYQNMWVLTDDQTDPNRQPTRQNMIQGMQWLVQGARPGDSLVFHYSGHGSQMLDTSGDELDGFDEVILPCDYKMAGYILDDDLHNILVKSLPYGARLTAVMDCCHSGTGMDLPYVHEATAASRDLANLLMFDKHMLKKNKKMKKGKKEKKEKKSKKKGHLREIQQLAFSQQAIGDVVEFSGCRDDQTAADTTFSGGYGQMRAGGAMTTAFIQAVNRSPQQSFADVVYGMRQILQQQGHTQIPQLSSDRPMDLNQMFAI